MKCRTMTQGEIVFRAALKRALSYRDMLSLKGAGNSPWKRLQEHLRHKPGYALLKGSRRWGNEVVVTWRVGKVKA